MTSDAAPIWASIVEELRRTVTADIFDIWLAPIEPVELEGGRLLLEAPAELRSWIVDRFGGALLAAARTVLGPGGVSRVEVRPAAGDTPRRGRPSAPEPERLPLADDIQLNPKFTFEQFVIGDANRFAHAAALAVAELPGQAYNPLFIYGPPGVGKTHLLHSIGNYVTAFGAGMTVRYTTVERFTNDFIASIQRNDGERFKARYRRNDILLVDDVQFLESKVKTEEELFHTFNALYEAGSQLVLTSDRPPADLTGLEDRMRERFASGLMTDITAPDLATRLAVLRKRIHHDGIQLADDAVVPLLAERVTSSIRHLEGALIRVVAFASLRGEPLTAPLAAAVLDRLEPPARERAGRFGREALTVERIQDLVAEQFSLTREELVSANRAARVSGPRQIAMFLAREHTSHSLPAIGQRFGGRDHTTVLYACKQTATRMARDPELHEAVRVLTDRLRRADADRND